jgi:hypothetical protein
MNSVCYKNKTGSTLYMHSIDKSETLITPSIELKPGQYTLMIGAENDAVYI